MGWSQREEEQKSVEALIRFLKIGLWVCLFVWAYCHAAMEKAAAKPLTLKEQTAAIQARWEANARARQEVRP